MNTQINIPFTVKSHQEDGFFCGYASVFDVTDHHQEVVARKAFQNSLTKWKEKGRMPKMLWQHDQRKPIGVWDEIYEDEHGLYVKGRLLLDLQSGRDAYALMKAGVIDSMSIGFRPIKASRDSVKKARIITEIDLLEISLVTFAANPDAKVTAVKEFDLDAEIIRQIRELGEMLRARRLTQERN